MNPFSRKFWRGENEPGANQVVRRGSSWFGGLFGSAMGDAPVLTPDQALEVSAVYASVKMLSQDIGRMPINLVRRTYDAKGRERRTVLHNHPMSQLLSIKPNKWQTPYEFVTTMMTQVLLTGNALALKLKNGTGQVTSIVPIPAGSWQHEQLGNGELVFHVNFETGRRTFYQREVIYIRSAISLDGFQSFNPTMLARQAFGISSGLEKIQLNLSNNNGRPSGVLTFDEPSGDDEDDEDIAAGWNAKFGPGGTGGVAVLSAPNAKYYPVQMSLVDSQFIESRKFAVEEVARFFGIPFEKIIPSTKTYASAVQTARSYVTDALMPHVVMIEQALRRDLLSNDPELIFDFDEKDLLRGSNMETAEYVMKLRGSPGQWGVISTNEARYELGMDLLEGDEYELPQLNAVVPDAEIEKEQE